MGQKVLTVVVALAAALGFAFAAVSTSDFVAHLDRQVHGIHCSFLPGVDAPDVSGTSGCHATLMSPYSSVLRDRVWGGIPISLLAMAVFAYLAMFAIVLLVLRRQDDRRATGFLLAANGLPLLASIVMGAIALGELDAACKLCIGIYVSSVVGFGAALALFVRSRGTAVPGRATREELRERLGGPPPKIVARGSRSEYDEPPAADVTLRDPSLAVADTIEADRDQLTGKRRLATESEMERRLGGDRHPRNRARESGVRDEGTAMPIGWAALAAAFALGVVFVIAPTLAYAANSPDFTRFVGACGTLAQPDGRGVLVPLGPQGRDVSVIEVLDPLCPTCRGFERRFVELPIAEQMSRQALLFPLDDSCNWMVDHAIHPGACTVSEAVLCADEDADEVITWAFENQEAILEASRADAGAAARMVRQRFPALASCLGSPAVRARLNRALRWAVANQLPVLTPQIFVGDTRICDADTDLGLDWTLSQAVDRARARGAR